MQRQMRTAVLVEGLSDKHAIETLAARHGRELAAEGIEVVAMGGAQAIGRYLERYGPRGENLRLAGLCDLQEERDFRRGLELAGGGAELTREDMERLGFFVCVRDLEEELIRAHGADGVLRIAEAKRDLQTFRTLQKQPAWNGRPTEEQLRRWMGSGGRRKLRYAAYLVEELELEKMPRPLVGVLEAALG
jgi:hypothetical protein